jgi:hypothetical protein
MLSSLPVPVRRLRSPGNGGKGKRRAGAPRETPQTRPVEPEAAIVCRQCRHPVTRPQERIAMAGSHRHSFANPTGLVFEIGCFRQASGCRLAGPASLEFSWFPGYRWRIALCGGCQVQLGWRFESPAQQSFSGLILERLLSADPSRGTS